MQQQEGGGEGESPEKADEYTDKASKSRPGHSRSGHSRRTLSQQIPQVSAQDAAQLYKTQRFCNTIKVYQKFCRQTGVQPSWTAREASVSGVSDSYHPVNPRVRSMAFSKYADRPDSTKTGPDAHEGRFKKTHGSIISGQTRSFNIGKYSSRDTRVSMGLPFEVNMSCNYIDDSQLKSSEPSTQAHSFQAEQLWSNVQHKRDFKQFRLKGDQLKRVDFDNVYAKRKSVKPKKGNALRKQIDRQDDQLFELFIGKMNKKKVVRDVGRINLSADLDY